MKGPRKLSIVIAAAVAVTVGDVRDPAAAAAGVSQQNANPAAKSQTA